MKVFVFGASGFVGQPVALALAQQGHTVYGQTRSKEAAKKLQAAEIIPVLSSPSDVNLWKSAVSKSDVVIDSVGGSADISKIGPFLFDQVRKIAEEVRGKGGPKMTYIYTSGTWVHGTSLDFEESCSDQAPLNHPIELTAWRVPLEQMIIGVQSKAIQGIVIRPALLYGHSASLFHPLFTQAKQGGTLEWPGYSGCKWSTIHTDDLARLYVLVAQKAPILGGLCFDAANPTPEPSDSILSSLVSASGSSGYKYKTPSNLYETALMTNSRLKPSMAYDLLGWLPRKLTLAEGMEGYWKAWEASQES